MSVSPVVPRNVPQLGTLLFERESGTRATWLHVSGELDLATAPQLKEALAEAHRDSLLVVLEPRGLTFIDCAGLRVIIDAAARARRERGWLLLVASSPIFERLLVLTGVQDLVTVFDVDSDPGTFGTRRRQPVPDATLPPVVASERVPRALRPGGLKVVPDAEAAPPPSCVRETAWPRPSPGRGHATTWTTPN